MRCLLANENVASGEALNQSQDKNFRWALQVQSRRAGGISSGAGKPGRERRDSGDDSRAQLKGGENSVYQRPFVVVEERVGEVVEGPLTAFAVAGFGMEEAASVRASATPSNLFHQAIIPKRPNHKVLEKSGPYSK